ncbi:MAG: hypothetical protein FJ267_10075 [Planctomycetes bacterium]|nr:hypothetical protein [Planctomycetota bacterium]
MVTTWGAKPVISDYAHHPTAIRATLRMTRQVYGDRRIWAIFQPHQVSRTKSLMDDFSKCFESADEVIIVPVYAARETVVNEPIECAEELVRRIAKTGGRARFVESLDRIAPTVEDSAHDDDVVVVMGAGDIERCFEPK